MTDVFDRYTSFISTMTGDTVSELKTYCTPDVHFQDPFNNVRSADAYVAIMSEAYEKFSDVRFEIIDIFRSGDKAVIKWTCHFTMQDKPPAAITGLSEVEQNAEGLISSHVDYWDSGERIYAKIPVIGALIRFIRNKLSAGLDHKYPA